MSKTFVKCGAAPPALDLQNKTARQDKTREKESELHDKTKESQDKTGDNNKTRQRQEKQDKTMNKKNRNL